MIHWDLHIRKGDNGYRLTYEEELGNGEILGREEYIQDSDDDPLKAGEELLWRIMEYFNFYGSKHDSERLRVIRVKRDE